MIANRVGRNSKKLSRIIGASFPVVMAVQELLLFPVELPTRAAVG